VRACNLCAAGTDCKVVKQSKAGKANGVRLVLNVAIEQDAAIYPAKNSGWASGATIFLHSRLDDMNSGTRVLVPPSMVTDVSIGQGVTKETNFPYTTPIQLLENIHYRWVALPIELCATRAGD